MTSINLLTVLLLKNEWFERKNENKEEKNIILKFIFKDKRLKH